MIREKASPSGSVIRKKILLLLIPTATLLLFTQGPTCTVAVRLSKVVHSALQDSRNLTKAVAAGRRSKRHDYSASRSRIPSMDQPSLMPKAEAFPVCFASGSSKVSIFAAAMSSRVWRGWGTSLAWWANYVGGLPQDQQDDILDLLFSIDKGLGLNIVRYNIGGGYSAKNSPQLAQDDISRFRGIPGYRPDPNGGYDWTADAAQKAVLWGALSRDADTSLAFSLSPPWWMTVSGDVTGSEDGLSCNVKQEYFEEYADYLTEVVKYFYTDLNLTFHGLAPVNEPNDGGWRKGGVQEGCSFDIQDMEDFLPAVRASLDLKGLSTHMVGPDSWARSTAYNLQLLSRNVTSDFGFIESHTYVVLNKDIPRVAAEQQFGNLKAQADKLSKEVWGSEWTFVSYQGNELDLGLAMARNIIESVNILRATAWVFWQVVDMAPRFSVLQVSWDNNQMNSLPHVKTKKFHILNQFTHLAPPGSRAIPIHVETGCHHSVAVFFNSWTGILAVFIVNQENVSASLSLSIAGFVPKNVSDLQTRAFRTSATEDFAPLGPHSLVLDGESSIVVPGRSFTTLVFGKVVVTAS